MITDLNMPGMDGLALLEKLRDRADTRETPVLLLTTETNTDVKNRAKALRATSWIRKPFDTGSLLSTIESVLE